MKTAILRNRRAVVLASGKRLERDEPVSVSDADARMLEEHPLWRVEITDEPAPRAEREQKEAE